MLGQNTKLFVFSTIFSFSQYTMFLQLFFDRQCPRIQVKKLFCVANILPNPAHLLIFLYMFHSYTLSRLSIIDKGYKYNQNNYNT